METVFCRFFIPYAFLSPEEYKRLLSEVGLIPVRVEFIPKDMKFAEATGLAGWIRTTWLPYIQHLPKELQAKFIDELTQRYLKCSPPDTMEEWHGAS